MRAAKSSQALQRAKTVLRIEAEAIRRLIPRVGRAFEQAVELVLRCRGRIVVTGMGKAGKPMNIKKGQFLAPWDMRHVIEKARAAGNRSVLVTERGATFGYNNLVSDMRSLQILRGFGCPVIYDGTHSVQLPGGLGGASGGQREFVPTLVRAAVATGFCDGVFMEVHEDPDHAPVDGPNMLKLADLPRLLDQIQAIRAALRR